jgi:hypothetical protein
MPEYYRLVAAAIIEAGNLELCHADFFHPAASFSVVGSSSVG